MSISTRRGDDGTTKLYHGPRVSKAGPRLAGGGDLDELGAQLGLARALLGADPLAARLEALQRALFVAGAEVSTPPAARARLAERLTPAHLDDLDAQVAALEAEPGMLDGWSLPGATVPGAALDVARAVCRRAERGLVALCAAEDDAFPVLSPWLNRLSDLLWLYGRWYELRHGADSGLKADRGW
jgi:cob(I)alamin adenosyltransferase